MRSEPSRRHFLKTLQHDLQEMGENNIRHHVLQLIIFIKAHKSFLLQGKSSQAPGYDFKKRLQQRAWKRL